MARNVEIKARARNWEFQMRRAVALASSREHLRQEDTFFACAAGRLKLRTIEAAAESAQLIFYRRPDSGAPKLSDYALCPVSDPDGLRDVLARAFGTRATVRKVRTVFHCGQTRVHFDDVEGLGRFIELEVVLRVDQSAEEGGAIARGLMEQLAIGEEDLVAAAYADLLADGAAPA